VPRIGAVVVGVVLSLPPQSAAADDVVADDNVADQDDSSTRDEAEREYLYSDPCPDRDGVVGERRCPAYGEWAVDWPYVMVRFGVNLRHLPGQAKTPTIRIARSVSTPVVDNASSETNYTVSEQIAIAGNNASYFAFEIEFSPSSDGSAEPGKRSFAAGSNLVLGLHGGTHAVRVGAELAGGIRLLDTAAGDSEQAVLETRLRADLWLTPWMTLGAQVGFSLLERDDWVTGICVGAHSFAFGGL